MGLNRLQELYFINSCVHFKSSTASVKYAIQEMEGDVIVAGSFNARALEWYMPKPDCRGKQIVEILSRLIW